MKDQCETVDCETYLGDGIKKRENLKANSSGRPGTSHDSRSSFFKGSLPPEILSISKKQLQESHFVAEPAEIPIFRFPEALTGARTSYQKAANMPPFFNST